MLFLLTLLALTYAQQSTAYVTIASKIAAGEASQSMIQMAYASEAITIQEAQQLLTLFSAWVDQANAAAEAAKEQTTNTAIAAECVPTDAVARHTTPVIDGKFGYGASQCSDLPAVYWDDATVDSGVPDLSGTYVMDGGMCPAAAAGGNQIRIEQQGSEIMMIGSGVVHHFAAEAVGCPATCADIKNACVGQNALSAAAECSVVAIAIPDMVNGCWTLQSEIASVQWCKTDAGVSRAVPGMGMQTFTAVSTSTRRRKQ